MCRLKEREREEAKDGFIYPMHSMLARKGIDRTNKPLNRRQVHLQVVDVFQDQPNSVIFRNIDDFVL
jgi:hypothetical protein